MWWWCLGVCSLLLPVRLGGAYVEGGSKLTYGEAKQACAVIGGRLPAADTSSASMDVAAYMRSHNISGTWVEPRLHIMPWHYTKGDDDTVTWVSDQGCYEVTGGDESENQGDECVHHCRRLNYQFATVQTPGAAPTCICANNTMPLTREIEQPCYEVGCNNPCTKGGRTHHVDPPPTRLSGLQWASNGSGVAGNLCTSVLIQRKHSPAHAVSLAQEACYQEYRSICCSNGASVLPGMSWFDAISTCRDMGGEFVNPNHKCAIPVVLMSSLKHYWTTIKAWAWLVNDTVLHGVHYSNWTAHEPEFTTGQCIMLKPDGGWMTADCSKSITFVCDIEDTSTDKSSAAVIGVAVGVTAAVVLVITAVVMFVCFRRRKSNRNAGRDAGISIVENTVYERHSAGPRTDDMGNTQGEWTGDPQTQSPTNHYEVEPTSDAEPQADKHTYTELMP